MKTPEELNALKDEVETVSRKLAELTEEEAEQVTGGDLPGVDSGNHAAGTGDGFDYTIPKPYINPSLK